RCNTHTRITQQQQLLSSRPAQLAGTCAGRPAEARRRSGARASHKTCRRVLVQRGHANHSKQRRLRTGCLQIPYRSAGAVRARVLPLSTCQPFFAGDESHGRTPRARNT
ncbi:unnamed protein product, partial [Ectocarpus sp. 12 AP-2014]